MLLADRTPDIRPLRAHCTGDVVVPGERVWQDVLAAWDGIDPGEEPTAVVFPASDYDLIAVLSFVRFAGLRAVLAGTSDADDLSGGLGGTVLVHQPTTPPPWALV